MRVAHEYRLSPSRYLGLPWKRWGETDFWLTQGYADYLERLCPCGCGQFSADCTDPDTAGRWQVYLKQCQARDAIDDYQQEHSSELTAGSLIGVHLLPFGQVPRSPAALDEGEAAAQIEAMKRRHGLTD